MAEKKHYPGFNNVIILGTLTGVQKYNSQQGALLKGEIECPYDYTDQQGNHKTGSNKYPIMVHPSNLERLEVSIKNGEAVLIEGVLQVGKGSSQPDGSYKPGSWSVMIRNVTVLGTNILTNSFVHITLRGRLSRDSIVRNTAAGRSFTAFTVAVNDTYGEGTSFIDNTSFAKGSVSLSQKGYLLKGRDILVKGRITTGKDGRAQVSADQVELLGGGNSNSNGNNYNNNNSGFQQDYPESDFNSDVGMSQGLDITSDDLPF